MSTTAFLNTLRKYDLQQYYPNFSSKGVLTLEYLADLSMQDYSKLGVRSIDDKRKFMELANEVKLQKQKQQQQQKQKPQPKEKASLIISEQPKKRIATNLPSPDRKIRRLTIGPHPTQQMHQQYQRQPLTIPTSKNNNDFSPISNRRLSYIPSKQNQFNTSPNRYNNNNNNSNSLQRSIPTKPSTVRNISKQSTHPPPLPSSLDDFHVSEKKKPIIPIQAPERHLDAYGIPKSNSRRRLSIDGISGGSINNNNSKSLLNTSTYLNTNTNKSSAPSFTSSKIQNNAQHLLSELHQRIRVCVRKRPLSKKELSSGENDISQIVGPHTIQLNAPKARVDLTRYTEQHTFTYDEVFDCNSSNIEIYHRTARPLVDYVFNGGKATCFAFGQTGSGKTYTMLDPNHGLYIMAAKDIFAMLEQPQYNNLGASVGFYEIYQGKLYDLLNQRKQLIPRDDGNSNVVIAGLREYPISDLDRLMQIFDFGSRSRTTGKTGANDNSSRSHAVLQVLLKENGSDVIYGKLSFIDLAGSERGVDRGDANPKTRLEGAEINKSLLALKECIRALDQDKKHTPFRGSKLTQVLRDSFVGDSRTCMIATISPNHSNSEHTLNTLRYADRVKELKGESDPRLQTDHYLEMNQSEGYNNIDQQQNNNNSSSSQQNDSQSVTTSEAYWDDEITENIMDVDFPADAIASGAMGTPRSQRVWGGSTTPHRREKYLRRLSSPPEELFQQLTEDPFMSETTKSSKLTSNNNNNDNSSDNKKYKTSIIKKKISIFDNDDQKSNDKNETTDNNGNNDDYNNSKNSNKNNSSNNNDNINNSQLNSIISKESPISTKDSTSANSLREYTSRSGIIEEFYNGNDGSSSLSIRKPATATIVTKPSEVPSSSLSPSIQALSSSSILQKNIQNYNEGDKSNAQVPVEHIRDFIRLHRAQIKELEDCIKQEKKMIAKLTLTVSSHHDFNEEQTNQLDLMMNNVKITQEYENYLNDLEDVLERKMACVDTLKDRVKQELGDEIDDP